MQLAAPTTSFSFEELESGHLEALDRIIADTEGAELGLASSGGVDAREQRKSSGSFYTPADVADHFWTLFFRHHRLDDAEALRAFIDRTDLVEPSAGSGIFVFSFIRKALTMGLTAGEVARVRFHVIDINFAALSYFRVKLQEVERILGVTFSQVGPDQMDFLEWVKAARLSRVAFVGNPPFVTNGRGSRWRNLYADFLEAMLDYPAERSIGLILPLSISFSRDYAELRRRIHTSGMGVSASSYDNIPDCLFKSGKPESENTNRANSQRCTILNLGGADPLLREAASLLRWPAAERCRVLAAVPPFHDYRGYGFDDQIPRPESDRLMNYLAHARDGCCVRELLSRHAMPRFALAAVARNFIGIRDLSPGATGVLEIRPSSELDMLILLQIFASKLFYEYWRTAGDGFHVTNEVVERFPISTELHELCLRKADVAKSTWERRGCYAKEKLNSGRIVRSYDFSKAFEHLRH